MEVSCLILSVDKNVKTFLMVYLDEKLSNIGISIRMISTARNLMNYRIQVPSL